MGDYDVVDETSLHRFAVHLDGSAAALQYRVRGARLILVHTDVPKAMEGKGIGGLLVRAALDRARAEELTVVPWCNFARSWLEKHENEAATVDIDWESQPEN